MDIETARAAHEAAKTNRLNLDKNASDARAAVDAAKAARASLVATAATGATVRPGDLAKADAAIGSADRDAAAWKEAAELALTAERDAARQHDLENQILTLTAYRARCEERAEKADAVGKLIADTRAALAELETLDSQIAAAAPRHVIRQSGNSPIVSRILPNLDQLSTRGIYAPPKHRDDVLAGFVTLPTGRDHLDHVDREIAAARETAAARGK